MARNIFWILITIVLAPVFFGRIFLQRLKARKKGDLKILVIITGKIGDMVCATPAFREIKKKFPDSYLVAAIRKHGYGVVQNNPNINKFIFLYSEKYQGFLGKIRLVKEISREGFGWSINIGPNPLATILPYWAGIPKRITSTSRLAGKTAQLLSLFNNYRLEYKPHTSRIRHILELLKFLGIKNFSQKKEVFITKEEEEKAGRFLKKNNLKEEDFIIGISVTAGRKLKEWEPIKFNQLADRLIEELGAEITFIGAPNDKKIIQRVVTKMKNNAIVATDFKIHELAALFQKFKLFISVDTCPLYIAHAVGTPVVDIAGPVDINEQPPRDKRSEIVQKKIYCVPCSFIIPAAIECKEGHHRCIKETTVDNVLGAVVRIIKRCNIISHGKAL